MRAPAGWDLGRARHQCSRVSKRPSIFLPMRMTHSADRIRKIDAPIAITQARNAIAPALLQRAFSPKFTRLAVTHDNKTVITTSWTLLLDEQPELA